MAIAAIWFLVFLPSFVKGDQSKIRERETLRQVQSSATNRLGVQAQQALKARRVRTFFFTSSAISFVVGALASLEVLATASGLPVAIGAFLATGLFVSLSIKANRNYRNLLTGSVKRSVPLSAPRLQQIEPVKTSEANTWQPDALPKQGYLKTGAIEIVNLAEVVSIEKEETAHELESIDEILRRRRHIG